MHRARGVLTQHKCKLRKGAEEGILSWSTKEQQLPMPPRAARSPIRACPACTAAYSSAQSLSPLTSRGGGRPHSFVRRGRAAILGCRRVHPVIVKNEWRGKAVPLTTTPRCGLAAARLAALLQCVRRAGSFLIQGRACRPGARLGRSPPLAIASGWPLGTPRPSTVRFSDRPRRSHREAARYGRCACSDAAHSNVMKRKGAVHLTRQESR